MSDGAATPEISVAVATCNRASRLAALLESLRAQTLDRAAFEIVIVDDGSSDETPAVLEREVERGELPLRTLASPSSRGPAGARNAAWRATSGPTVAFTDDDCVVVPGWLEALAKTAKANPEAIVQGTTAPAPDELDARGIFSRTLEVTKLGPYFQTANIAYPRRVLEELGGFDEATFGRHPGGEDTDLAWRAIERGAGAVLAAEARVFHAVNELGPIGATRFPLRWTDTMAVFARHPGLRGRLHRRIFWKRSHELFLRALVGAALARRLPPALLLAYPYARDVVLRTRRAGSPAEYAPFLALQDAVEVYATIRGAIKHRVPVV